MKIKLLKNYFLEIWLVFVVTIAAATVTLSLVLSSVFETSTIDVINSINKDIIHETSRINEYVRRSIKVSGMELFFEPSVQRLMYHDGLSNFDILTGLRRLDSVQSMGTHIHSIYVFNAPTGFVYSTSNFRSSTIETFFDSGIGDLLFSDVDPMRLVPVPRMVPGRSGDTPVYSFVYYDPMPFRGPDGGALIINITIDWLSEIVGTSADSSSLLLFVDRFGKVIYHPDPTHFLSNLSHEPFVRTILSSHDSSGHFVDSSGDGQRLVIYTESDEGDLYLIRLFPYDRLMGRVRTMRSRTLILAAAFLGAGILVAFFCSRKIYRPIGKLIAALKPEGTRGNQNEIEYLSTAIETMITKTSSLEAISESYRETLQVEVLKELLSGNVQGRQHIEALFHEYHLPFVIDGSFWLVRAQGDYPQALPHLTDSDVLPALDLRIASDTVVLIQHEDTAVADRVAHSLIREGARLVVCSGRISNAVGLSTAYASLVDYHKLSLLFGSAGVLSLTGRVVNGGDFAYPTDLEKAILHCLRAGDAERATEQLDEFLSVVGRYRFDHVRFSVKRLYVSIQFLIKELQAQGYFEGYCDFCIDELEHSLSDLAGHRSIRAEFADMVVCFQKEIHTHRINRIKKLAEEIEAIVEGDYRNPNLSTSSIADTVGLSASYLSRVYKELRSVSISEHIINIRIEAAKTLLLEHGISAREVASRTGFANDNYFYTLFRKKTGVTPSNYRKRLLVN